MNVLGMKFKIIVFLRENLIYMIQTRFFGLTYINLIKEISFILLVMVSIFLND